MREATEIEKIITELTWHTDTLFKITPAQTDPRTVDNTSIRLCYANAQERLVEARMWLEEAEKLSDG